MGTTNDFNTYYYVYNSGPTSPNNFAIHSLNDSTCEIAFQSLLWANKNGTHGICNKGTPSFFPIKSHVYEVEYSFVPGIGYSANIYLADTTAHTLLLKDSISGTAMYYQGSDLYFTNDSTGYFLNRYWNGNSFIKKTTNYGVNWNDVLNSSDTLQAINFPTANTGYAVGDSGIVYKTINAGASWNKVNVPVKNNLFAVHFINADTGYVVGTKGVLYKTLNGGMTWNTENSNDTNSIIMIKMVDDSTAYFADYYNLYKNNFYTTSIKQYTHNNEQVNIYPNPNNGLFVIEPNGATKQTMQVYDVNGKMVLSQTINGRTSIDASALSEGVYNISLQSNEGVVNKRVVIVR